MEFLYHKTDAMTLGELPCTDRASSSAKDSLLHSADSRFIAKTVRENFWFRNTSMQFSIVIDIKYLEFMMKFNESFCDKMKYTQ